MGSRGYFRRANGQFRRGSLRQDFGIDVAICPACRRMNPSSVGESAPTHCHACGADLSAPVEEPEQTATDEAPLW